MRTRVLLLECFQKHLSLFVNRAGIAALLLLACCQTSRGALVAYWNFDEATGTNVFDTAGNVVTNNGFFAPAPQNPSWVPGRLGTAVGFTWQTTNVTSAGRRVIIPYHTNLTLNGPVTVSFWYRMDAPHPSGSFPGIMRMGAGGQSTLTGANVGWGFYHTTTMVYKRGNHQPPLYPTAMNVGQWNHFAFRWDGNLTGANTMGFLNGVATTWTATNGWSNITTTAILELGLMDQYDQATLDDLGLFGSEAVAPAKIRSLYTAPTALALDYNLADMRTLWGIFDAAGSSNAVVKSNAWTYAATVPGSTADGDAYVSGGNMYIVLGGGRGVQAPVTVVRGTFSPGGIGTVGTFTSADALVFTNANLVFDLNNDATPGGTVNDLFDVAGDLTIDNTRVTVDPLSPLLGGTYRLINYTGTKTGTLIVSNTTRYTLALDEATANQVNLTVSGTNGNVKWNST
ncbi:MAG TPA: hypothetical protein VK530_17060, partial [Candidatus Acidoferrum sp.]|nr:hypothetical protein [Candidatus Acidoferrum sp.]